MEKKEGNFFEKHIEKLILTLAAILCLWLFFTRVLFSPNYVEYDNRKFYPGDIDNYINEQAEELSDKLIQKPEPAQKYKPKFDKFAAIVDSSITGIDFNIAIPIPPRTSGDRIVNRKFHVPRIGEVTDVSAEHIRAVAYVPVGMIDEQNVYSQNNTEPNDIDFVTVEAQFDVAGLKNSFYESFAGEDVSEDWRDPCLAEPVFAAIELQRRHRLIDGSWSGWQIVPRAKIEAQKGLFEVIEDVNDLPAGGIKVRMLQYDNGQVRMDLLQPEAYRIASEEEEWFPPSLHKEFVKYQKTVQLEERRRAIEDREEEKKRKKEERIAGRERSRKTPKTTPEPTTGLGGLPGGFGGGIMDMMRGGGGAPPVVTPKKKSYDRKIRKERLEKRKARESQKTVKEKKGSKDVSDFYDDLDEILLDLNTEISEMTDEPLVFWAFDDTVEWEGEYQYRMRLGVFNPIAGTNQFVEEDKKYQNKVVLWTGFSEVTESVKIPSRLYFFPIREMAEIVTVQVSRYTMGYWYSKNFMVKKGETIGNVVDFEAEEKKEKEPKQELGQITVPETIDYDTGVVLVDIRTVQDWSVGSNMRERYYSDMLYSFDGADIYHIPIKSSYWPSDLQVKFNEIRKAENEPKKPLRAWGGKASRGPGFGPGMGVEGLPEGIDFMNLMFEGMGPQR